jgi:hypothetical protein
LALLYLSLRMGWWNWRVKYRFISNYHTPFKSIFNPQFLEFFIEFVLLKN